MSGHTTKNPESTPPSSRSDSPTNVNNRTDLSTYELEGEGRPPFVLSFPEVKLLGIAGVGFFLDAYDLFVINPVATMLQFRLYGGSSLPSNLEGFMKAGANIGSVIGQFAFGFAADYYGRKAVYGKELMLIIFATILCLTTPTGQLSPDGSLIYLAVFRIILGIGVGGDYPMSATISTDRAHLRRRGVLLSYIFANQGWGSFAGSLAFVATLACYKGVLDKGESSKLDGVWRIVIGLSLIPAFGTLYQRLTLPESTRYEDSKRDASAADEESIDSLKAKQAAEDSGSDKPKNETTTTTTVPAPAKQLVVTKKNHFKEFAEYFSEWRHLKHLLGTSLCWFLLDIAFYGINLNQNVVLQQIGFDGKTGTTFERLFHIGIGNLIITALGFVPGYYATVFSIEYLGRKWIQIQGFLFEALFLGILAGRFHSLSKVSFIVCFAFLQFFFNFGANTTTYCYPAEVFPTKFRATAHGISAASGKAGAIISALAFNSLTKDIGTPAVLWIFVGCCIAGAFCTLLLPEVKGRDPDVIYNEELRVRAQARASS